MTVNKILRKMILRMFTVDPAKRPTAKELLEILDENFRQRTRDYQCRFHGDEVEVEEGDQTESFQLKTVIDTEYRIYENKSTQKQIRMRIINKGQSDSRETKNLVFQLEGIQSPFLENFLWSFEDESNFYAISECTEGSNLRGLLGSKLNEDVAVRFLWQMLSGIKALNDKGIIHGHITPESIIVSSQMCIKLRYDIQCSDITEYTAPEFKLKGRLHSASDLWSVGVIGYEMCTGKFPFREGVKKEDPLPEDIGSALIKAIELAMTKSPRSRKTPEKIIEILRSEYGNVESLNLWAFEGETLKAMGFSECEHFTLERELGRGNYGTAYLYKGESGRKVVLKDNDKSKWMSREIRGYEREVTAMRKFHHPNIVHFFGSFENQNSFFIVMEYIEGTDLKKLLKKNGKLEQVLAIRILWQLATALACMHERKIVHKDIKPENILIDNNLNARLADFGISKQLDSQNGYGQTRLYSTKYAAPEMFTVGKYDTKFDIWSLGSVLYKMVIGIHPFENFEEQKHGNCRRIPKTLNKNLSTLITRMLTANPNQRPNISKVLDAIERVYGNLSKEVKVTVSGNEAHLNGEGFMDQNDSREHVLWINARDSIGSLHIGANVRSISDYAFAECNHLHQVIIPNGVMFIGNESFADCQQLSSVDLPESLTVIGKRAFMNCPLELGRIPYQVTDISEGLFCGCKALKKAVLAITIESIGESAFEGCVNLEQINFLPSLNAIAKRAFFECKSLTSFQIPDGVEAIEDEVFCGCCCLIEIILPSNLTRIGKRAFYMCNIEAIAIPDSVVSVGDEAFAKCQQLTSLILPAGLCEIGSGAFAGCINLSESKLPDSLKVLGSKAFSNCRSLSAIHLPRTLEVIENSTFSNCTKLASVTLPPSLTRIGESAFKSCRSLGQIDLPSTLHEIGKRSFYKCNLKEVVIPPEISSIEGETFYHCSQLEKVTVTGSLESIAEDAFNKTPVDTSTLPICKNVPKEEQKSESQPEHFRQ